MSCAIEANILLYVSDTSSPFHRPARALLDSLLAGPELVYVGWPVIMSYLRVATHPSVFDQPLSPEDAMANVALQLRLPHVRLLS
jgi:predicted nucleic acid-binding protein